MRRSSRRCASWRDVEAIIAPRGGASRMELNYIYATAAVMAGYFALQVLCRRFDPFAPIWLFLVGYVQIYVIQPITFHEWAVRVRGVELVTAANARAFWALLWMLAVYHCGIGRLLSALVPKPPRAWTIAPIAVLCPLLTVWGLISAGMLLRAGGGADAMLSPEESLFRSFHCVLLVSAILLIITGRSGPRPRPALAAVGLATGAAYVMIWMFNGKRSHSLMGVLCTTCAFYISRMRRPSWPVLIGTAFTGALVVAIAIGWRGNKDYEQSFSGFVQFLGDFQVDKILVSLNLDEEEEHRKFITHETKEYGGLLIMMDAVPDKSDYDYGVNYLRIFSTFIPRMLWIDKPLFGREQWIKAWIASSELKRDLDFTGPAIGLLGATHLNGGASGTAIVLACLALLLRTAYEYFRRYASAPWVQAWWTLIFFNAWFMVVCDDPMVWFYYNWGFTTMPPLTVLWICNKLAAPTGV
ncbi:MAG TPA: hypothetical protein VKP69_11490, partial [Isosphaeraceae bacterium]|nr:hypothetical protein [Isosphaeraceae bacterium]